MEEFITLHWSFQESSLFVSAFYCVEFHIFQTFYSVDLLPLVISSVTLEKTAPIRIVLLSLNVYVLCVCAINELVTNCSNNNCSPSVFITSVHHSNIRSFPVMYTASGISKSIILFCFESF